jgi:glycogen synthase
MKLLVISNYYPPYFQGGYEICCEEMCRYLVGKGHDIYILTGTYGISSPSLDYQEIKKDEPLRILRYLDYNSKDYFNKHKVEKFNYNIVKQVILDMDPELVYFWSLKELSLAPAYAARDLKRKVFYDIGDTWMDAYYAPGISGKLKRFIKKVSPFTIGGSLRYDPIMLSTQWMVPKMRDIYYSKRIYVIPRGLDLPAPIEKRNNSVVGYMFTGRIEPLKGLDICLQAFGKIRKEDPGFQFKFDIYGAVDEPYGSFCHTLVKELTLEKDVTFHGRIDPIQPEYAKYDVLLMPTMAKEAFGRVILEAMIEGQVVIASNHYGPAEIIHHGVDGFLFEPGNADALADVIMHVHNNESLRTSIGNAAIQLVKTKYDNQIVMKQVEDILIKEVGNETH